MLAQGFDVIVVGARCAGSPLAAMLARAGLDVAVVERATFPRDTLSTHIFETDGLSFLDRLGVTDKLRATGAPFTMRSNSRADGFQFNAPWPLRNGDVGGGASVRRTVLDPILAGAAEDAGAQVRMATEVTGLVKDGNRVTGVRVRTHGREDQLRARLVIGADGRNSTVGNLVAARKYNVVTGQRFAYWAFFSGAHMPAVPSNVFHRWGDKFVIAAPCDEGLYQVIVVPELGQLQRFRDDLDGCFMADAQSCEPVAEALAGAQRVSKYFGMLHWTGFFREPSGPGWALVGDAGHFKDPSAGRGISDAFAQVDALVPAVVRGANGSPDEQDAALGHWGRWRDREFADHYWFANDLGKSGAVPTVFSQMVADLHAKGEIGRFLDLFTHREKPSQVLSPARLFGSAGRLLRHQHQGRRAVLNEVRSLVGESAHRQFLNHRHAYIPAEEALKPAGATEVDANSTC
ncbi:NAD(P)/FAD-dependent oxidoreductase [Mycolicibacterium sp. CBMA 226]|uniref:NAD(P)/FAD-dependent oxidoreductase n=1 Tax=Mycolicibacterium sp. CBMA 226 TaxID=2606611 RepID=UPI0012DD9C30|nr:NAD(P)/FAD-dependent oxidoreductase [Mycolicibacterium sp. CBMA 226]MUL75097.1 NAD(P)/FAD-dependent oxidoreductase [Mycolicibacterium sp. CBMA 226]